MKNKIEDLRNHLFATLEGLVDEDQEVEPGRVRAIVSVSEAIIKSAKLELEFMKITGGRPAGSSFEPLPERIDKGKT